MLGIPRAVDVDARGGGFDVAQVRGGQLDRGRAEVLLEPRDLRRARDRDDPRLLREQPRERDLRGRCLLARGERLQPLNEGEVRLAVLRREARDDVPEVRLLERRLIVDLAGEESLAERAE